MEPEELVKKRYPELVAAYVEAENAKNQKKKTKKPNNAKSKTAEKRALVDNKVQQKNAPSIKEFFKVQKKVAKFSPASEAKLKFSSTPKRKPSLSPIPEAKPSMSSARFSPIPETKTHLSALFSQIEQEDEDLNLSDVIEDIISRPGIYSKSEIRPETEFDSNSSCFFFDDNFMHDEFETTFNNLTKPSLV